MKAARVRFSPSVDLNSLATRSRNGRKSLYARYNSSPCVLHCQHYRCCYRRCKSRQIKPMGIMLSINLFLLKNKTRKQRIRNDLLPILYWNLPPWGSVYSIHQNFFNEHTFLSPACADTPKELSNHSESLKTHQNPSKQHIQFVS